MSVQLTEGEVLDRWEGLPPFPRSVVEILASLDDDDGNSRLLAELASLDPVITGRVLAGANTAAMRMGRGTEVTDLYVAISMLGLSRVREIVIMASMAAFFDGTMPHRIALSLRQHSVAAGVCAQELARECRGLVTIESALVAGLMHDIGQLWLLRFEPEALMSLRSRERGNRRSDEECERERFGVDHARIGAWLAQSWNLPQEVVMAIEHHHWPDDVSGPDLVPLAHVAEVLSNALDMGAGDSHVSRLSAQACMRLGFEWDDSCRDMFGRITGRYAHALAVLARMG